MLRWLPLLLLTGCATPPPEPQWFGHVGSPSEELLQPLRDRLKAEDAVQVRVRHAEPGDNPRAVAVRLLAVHGVKGLILGPGLSNPAEVVAAIRSYGVPVVVLDDSEAIEGAAVLGAKPGERLQLLLGALTPAERQTPVRLRYPSAEAEKALLLAGIPIDAKAKATIDPVACSYTSEGTRLEVIPESPPLVEAITHLLRTEAGETRRLTWKVRRTP